MEFRRKKKVRAYATRFWQQHTLKENSIWMDLRCEQKRIIGSALRQQLIN